MYQNEMSRGQSSPYVITLAVYLQNYSSHLCWINSKQGLQATLLFRRIFTCSGINRMSSHFYLMLFVFILTGTYLLFCVPLYDICMIDDMLVGSLLLAACGFPCKAMMLSKRYWLIVHGNG